MALPQLPIVAVCILLVLVVFVGPAFASAETAMLPQILDGERFVVGQALRTTTGQLARWPGSPVAASWWPRSAHALDLQWTPPHSHSQH